MLSKDDKNSLCDMLNELIKEQPCKGGGCDRMNCEYGVFGAYGDECSIEHVINDLSAESQK